MAEQHDIKLTFTGGVPAHLALHLGDTMALDTTALKAAVAAIESTGDSVIEVLNRIAAELATMAQNAADPAEIQALSDRLTAQAAEIAAAVDSHTPDTPPA